MGRQAGHQGRQQLAGTGSIEQIRPIGAEQRRQRAGDTHCLSGSLHRPPGQLAGQRCQSLAFGGETRLANMKRHDGIAVAGDDIGPAGNIGCVHGLYCLGGFAQGQRRPFGLPERRATALQFAAHAAVENDCRC